MTYYRVARIVNTFGIRGQLKLIADTDFPEERFASGKTLYILKDLNSQPLASVQVAKAAIHKGTWLISFVGYDNINQVEGFKGCWLAIDESEQDELEEDSYYHHQLLGLEVVTLEGKTLGKIKEILQLGSNDVFVVQRNIPKAKDALIPFIGDVVKAVDLEAGQVKVELMEGLIDDEAWCLDPLSWDVWAYASFSDGASSSQGIDWLPDP